MHTHNLHCPPRIHGNQCRVRFAFCELQEVLTGWDANGCCELLKVYRSNCSQWSEPIRLLISINSRRTSGSWSLRWWSRRWIRSAWDTPDVPTTPSLFHIFVFYEHLEPNSLATAASTCCAKGGSLARRILEIRNLRTRPALLCGSGGEGFDAHMAERSKRGQPCRRNLEIRNLRTRPALLCGFGGEGADAHMAERSSTTNSSLSPLTQS